MIQCKNLSLRYGSREILRNLSFTANPGEVTVLLGKNGSGKSTLLRALCGNLPYDGSIALCGRELRTIRPSDRAVMIGMMPQMLRAPEITVRELVSFGRHPYTGFSGVLSEEDRKFVGGVIADTGISEIENKLLSRISGGERQKAYFAMLLAQNPTCMVLDEPGAHLDTENMNDLCDFLSTVKKDGRTVLAVLHDINRAVAVADHLLVLHDRCAVFDGTPAQFCESDFPEKVFGLKKFVCRRQNESEERILFQ